MVFRKACRSGLSHRAVRTFVEIQPAVASAHRRTGIVQSHKEALVFRKQSDFNVFVSFHVPLLGFHQQLQPCTGIPRNSTCARLDSKISK